MKYETHVTHDWERDDGSVVTLEIGYSVSPVIPASLSGPEEGGGSLDYVTAHSIRWPDGHEATQAELDDAEREFPASMAEDIAATDSTERWENDQAAKEEAWERHLADANGIEI
jgi:hypothetical protein